MKKLILSLFVCSFIITFLINQNANASIDKQINSNLASIYEKINKEISVNSSAALSSNPYDYISGDEEFNGIVNLGNDALPVLQNKISQSPNNGLQEYIAAIAIERIAKVDLKKNESTAWETAKGFTDKWKKYLKNIPSSVDSIVMDNQKNTDEKVKELVELGTPAIPFIAEKIEAGDEQLFPVLIELTKGNGNKIVADASITNKKEWVTQNKSTFNDLKQYVLDQQ